MDACLALIRVTTVILELHLRAAAGDAGAVAELDALAVLLAGKERH